MERLSWKWGLIRFAPRYSPGFVAIDPIDSTGSADRSVGLLSRKAGGVRQAYEVRFDDMLKYRSPAMKGFSVDAGYWFDERSSDDASARREGDGFGVAGLLQDRPILMNVSGLRRCIGGSKTTKGPGYYCRRLRGGPSAYAAADGCEVSFRPHVIGHGSQALNPGLALAKR